MKLQASFLIPSEVLPARVGLLVTLCLCSNNTLNSVMKNTPKSGGQPNALVQWNIWCQACIILAILEYSWILLFKKFKTSAKIEGQQSGVEKARPFKTDAERALILD